MSVFNDGHAHVVGNVVVDNLAGIVASEARGSVVVGNRVFGNTGSGLRVSGDMCLVHGNRFDDNGLGSSAYVDTSGVVVDGALTTVTGNTIQAGASGLLRSLTASMPMGSRVVVLNDVKGVFARMNAMILAAGTSPLTTKVEETLFPDKALVTDRATASYPAGGSLVGLQDQRVGVYLTLAGDARNIVLGCVIRNHPVIAVLNSNTPNSSIVDHNGA